MSAGDEKLQAAEAVSRAAPEEGAAPAEKSEQGTTKRNCMGH